jgi:CheY-like chemotaxis protein
MDEARILVVDDNAINLKLAADVLGWAGYQVLNASSAEEALEVIEHTLPDLILMDVGLPGMDGLTLTRQLKAAAPTKHIPVVALTAFAMKGDAERALAAGCDSYISKPVDTRTLANEVARLLRKEPSR